MENIEKRILEVIERVRPLLQADGGDIKFIRFEEGIVYVDMVGACKGCSAINVTLYDGIESILLSEVPGVIGVELA
jgi:Fe-S cluster biogenesis protein NfuA